MQSQIPKSFARFQTRGDRVLENALNAAVAFCREYRAHNEARWISFCGTSGTGKTMLAKTIAHECGDWFRSDSGIITGVAAPVYYWPKVADKMRSGEWGLAAEIANRPLVVIDDVGAEYDPNKLIADKLSSIAGQRIGKWTVITSNLPFDQISARIDTRVSSRMIRGNNIVVEMNTMDFNLREGVAA